MFGITIKEAAALCNGSLKNANGVLENAEIKRVVIDSRKAQSGDIFAAYKGDKVDGHNYIAAAFANGASCALAEYVPDGVNGPVICVNDVQTALEDIVSAFRQQIDIPVVGITGSVGKTTAKEMVSSVLSQHFNVHKTAGNLNNTIGVPISVSEINKEHEAAIIEMGINHFGEMTHLAKVALPDIMLYTVIGHAHLEFLQDLVGVLRAKTEVLDYISPDATVIINGDDPMQRTINCRQKLFSYGINTDCDVKAYNIKSSTLHISCNIKYGARDIEVTIPSFGMHMVYAALEGAAVGFCLGLSDDEISAGIASFKNIGRRQALIDAGFIKVIDDCYNANPDSMKSSIDSLAQFDGRRICVLGDMRELGNNSPEMHYDIGKYAIEKGIDYILGSGEYTKETCNAAGDKGFYFDSTAELMEYLKHFIKKNDTVLVKASLGSNFAPVSEFLKGLKEESIL